MPVFNLVSQISPANSTLESQQHQPRVVVLSDGRFLVAWTSKTDPTGPDWYQNADIMGRFFTADGLPAGEDFIIEGADGRWDQLPELAALPDGGFVATWFGAGESHSGTNRVQSRVFDANGEPATEAFSISDHSNIQSLDVSGVAVLSDGRFVVVHEMTQHIPYVGSNAGIQFEIRNTDGTVAVPTGWVSTTPSFINEWPTVRALNDGRFAVTWQARVNNYDPNPDHPALDAESNAILLRLFDGDGTPEGDPIIVNTTEAGNQWDPRMSVLADGGIVITWTDENGDGSNSGIRGQVLNSDGTPRGSEFLVNMTTASRQDEHSVTALPGGGFVVIWESDYQGIVGQVFTSAGVPIGGETVLIDDAPGLQDPYVAAIGDGRIALVSTDVVYFGVGDLESNIHVRVLDIPALNPTPTTGDYRAAFDNSGQDVDMLAGNDLAVGGLGDDHLMGSEGADTLEGTAGADTLDGGLDDDSLSGGEDDDRLLGGAGDDTLDGGAGNDSLSGSDGNDSLTGGDGNDTVAGDGGDDDLIGGAGDDLLTGGDGIDTFHFGAVSGNDSIADFLIGTDILDFGEISPDDVTISEVGGNRVLTLPGGATVTLLGVPGNFDPTGEVVVSGNAT